MRVLTYLTLLGARLAAQSSDSALHVGDAFPRLAGQSIAGQAIDVPAPHAARPVVVIVSFSRAAGNDAQRWDSLLTRDRKSDSLDVVVVAELQSVPRLIRGTVAYAIRRGISTDLRERMVLLDHDEALWKRRLSVTSTDRAYAVLVDPAAKIRWLGDGQSADESVERLREAIRRSRSGGDTRH